MTRFADRLDQFVRWFFDSSPTTVNARVPYGVQGNLQGRSNPAPGPTGRRHSKETS